jgi:hypothetical protein
VQASGSSKESSFGRKSRNMEGIVKQLYKYEKEHNFDGFSEFSLSER